MPLWSILLPRANGRNASIARRSPTGSSRGTSRSSEEAPVSTALKTVSPVDGRVYVERELADDAAINRALESARRAQLDWRSLPLTTRCALLADAVRKIVSH